MNRRHLLAVTFAAALSPMAAIAAGFVDYAPGVIKSALDSGKTVLVDYSASWCSTCQRQKRVINALRAENPSYDAAIDFVLVDWDTYKNEAVARDRAVPRRSTLILLRGDEELGRVVAGTSEADIKALLDKGL